MQGPSGTAGTTPGTAAPKPRPPDNAAGASAGAPAPGGGALPPVPPAADAGELDGGTADPTSTDDDTDAGL